MTGPNGPGFDLSAFREILTRTESDLSRRISDVEQRMTTLAASTIPASAYEERSRYTQEAIAGLRAADAKETEARQAELAREITALRARLDSESASRSNWVRLLAGGVLAALISVVVDILRSTGAA